MVMVESLQLGNSVDPNIVNSFEIGLKQDNDNKITTYLGTQIKMCITNLLSMSPFILRLCLGYSALKS